MPMVIQSTQAMGFNLKVAGINLLQLNIDSLNIEHCAFKHEKRSD